MTDQTRDFDADKPLSVGNGYTVCGKKSSDEVTTGILENVDCSDCLEVIHDE